MFKTTLNNWLRAPVRIVKMKNDHDDRFDDLVIGSAKGISLLLTGIGGLCAAIILYGFFQHLLTLAVG